MLSARVYKRRAENRSPHDERSAVLESGQGAHEDPDAAPRAGFNRSRQASASKGISTAKKKKKKKKKPRLVLITVPGGFPIIK